MSDGMQQARCPYCDIPLGGEHVQGCPYPMERAKLERNMTDLERAEAGLGWGTWAPNPAAAPIAERGPALSQRITEEARCIAESLFANLETPFNETCDYDHDGVKDIQRIAAAIEECAAGMRETCAGMVESLGRDGGGPEGWSEAIAAAAAVIRGKA